MTKYCYISGKDIHVLAMDSQHQPWDIPEGKARKKTNNNATPVESHIQRQVNS